MSTTSSNCNKEKPSWFYSRLTVSLNKLRRREEIFNQMVLYAPVDKSISTLRHYTHVE